MAVRPAFAIVALALLVPSAWAQGVQIIRPAGGLQFPEIQQAVDAATDGDALLVAEGSYAPFTIDGKSLSVFAVPDAVVNVGFTVTVLNLAPHQAVVLSGLVIAPSGNPGITSVRLLDNQGSVRLQDCRLGHEGQNDLVGWDCAFGAPPDGVPCLVASDCAQLALVNCVLFGQPGTSTGDYWGHFCDAGTGGAGLEVLRSSVALYGCHVRGGAGGFRTYYGIGIGGIGLVASESTVFSSGGSLHGGPGGSSYYCCGPGGDGVWLDPNTELTVVGCSVAGAPSNSIPGTAVTGPGRFVPLEGAARAVAATTVWPAEVQLDVVYDGVPGDLVWAPVSSALDQLHLSGLFGVWLTEFPPAQGFTPHGRVDSTGRLHVPLALPALLPGAAHATFAVQGLSVGPPFSSLLAGPASVGAVPDRDATGLVLDRRLASARHVLALDALIGPDCNGNGISDYLDVVLGTSVDANHDLYPDECVPPGRTIHVDVAAQPGGDGSASAPFQTLAEGVAFALNGDRVLVADGVYTGPGNRNVAPGAREIDIVSANGPAGCTIDLAGAPRAFVFEPASGTLGSRIAGFTIRDGGPGHPERVIDIDRPNVIVADCVIENCGVADAIRLSSSSVGATIERCRVRHCDSAIWSYADSLTVRDCVLEQNSDRGIWASGNRMLIANSLVARNRLGVVVFPGGSTTPANRIVNLTVVDNSDGGVEVISFSNATQTDVSNCILWGNQPAGFHQMRLYQAPDSSVTVAYCDVQGGQAAVELANSSPTALVWAAGNLDLDPLFVDSGTGDLRLGPSSPCVDAGDNAQASGLLVDLDGNPRFVDDPTVPDTGSGSPPIVDLGCFERQ